MDGTLIDTEKYYQICWKQALSDFGYTMSREQALSMRSLGRPYAPARLKEYFGEDIDYYKVRDHRKALMAELISRQGIDEKPGAYELLMYLKERGHTAAIATATDATRSEEYLSHTRLRPFISRIVTATDVKNGKPAPDIYLYACEALGEAPSECYAIEDSPNGITSAYRAGCKTVMIPDQTPVTKDLTQMLYAFYDTLTDFMKSLKEKGI